MGVVKWQDYLPQIPLLACFYAFFLSGHGQDIQVNKVYLKRYIERLVLFKLYLAGCGGH